jgi:hypothetical protein
LSSEQGSVYASFIESQVKAEMERKTNLDERGSRLQQASSLTVGLFVAALGMLLGKDQRMTEPGLGFFVSSVVFLMLAFLSGVVATRLFKYKVATPVTLMAMLGEAHWTDTEITSKNNTAWLNVETLQHLRPGNNVKALALLCGVVAQGIGVILGIVTFVAVAKAGTILG